MHIIDIHKQNPKLNQIKILYLPKSSFIAFISLKNCIVFLAPTKYDKLHALSFADITPLQIISLPSLTGRGRGRVYFLTCPFPLIIHL